MTLPAIHERVLSILRKHKVVSKRYLDIGYADSKFTIQVARQVGSSETYGVDVWDEVLPKSSEIKTAKVDIFKDKLPFPDGYFDLVTAIEVIEQQN